MPKHDQPIAVNIGRFYVVVKVNGASYYAFCSGDDALMLHHSSTMAEAFTMEELPKIKAIVHSFFPGADFLPLECNTRALIPARMRKTFNAYPFSNGTHDAA